MNQEPVAIAGAVNSAIVATLAILLFAGINPDLIGSIGLAATAWVAVAALFVRSKVTPSEPVVQLRTDNGQVSFETLVVMVAVAIIVVALFWALIIR